MTKEEIRAKMRELRAEKAGLVKKADASDAPDEIRAISAKLDEINKQYDGLEDKMYDCFDEPAQRSASPLGKGQILATYIMGGKGPTTNQERGITMNMTPEEQLRDSQEYREAFYKTMIGKGTLEQRDLVTLTTGAAVVPTNLFSEVVANAQKAQGLLGHVRILNIPGKLTVPTSDIATPATWHTEGAPILESNTPPDSVSLTGFELVKLFSMSAATQAMSMAAFEKYLVEELSRAMRDALSASIPSGAGTTEPLGILNAFVWGAANSVGYAATPTIANLTTGMKLLASNFRQNAVWSCTSAYFSDRLAGLADANGHPIFAKDLASGAPLSLMGKPVVIDDFMPDDTLIFGDASKYFLNFSAPIAVQRSTEAGFTTASILYRGLAVCDGKPVAPAFVKIAKS